MELDSDLNPDLYRGTTLTGDALIGRMAKITGKGVNFPRKPKPLESHYVPMSQFGKKQSVITRQKILDVIGKSLIGNRFLYALDSATGVLVVKSDQSDCEGVAVYRYGSHAVKEEGKYRTEPYLSMEGFGYRNEANNGVVLAEIARQTIATADRVSQTMELITGRKDETYRPTVIMNAHNMLRPTAPAEQFNRQLTGLITHLQRVLLNEPRMGTGFNDKLNDAMTVLKELCREHPDHAVVRSLNGIRELPRIEQLLTGGGIESEYVFTQKVFSAMLALLTGVHRGTQDVFEQLHPGNAGRPVETTVENADASGGFSLSLTDGEHPVGTVNFITESLQDEKPRFDFHCYGDDVTSELAAAGLKQATQGEWWMAQLRR